MLTLLIIEDSRSLQLGFKEDVKGVANVLPAHTVEEARQFIKDYPSLKHFDFVWVDGALSFNGDTIPLVKELREVGFPGIIVAISATPKTNEKLVEAGCTFSEGKPFLASELYKQMLRKK